jgi:hypothetical protein
MQATVPRPGPRSRVTVAWPTARRDLLLLGLYLTLRGYHSLDNDQAYRLPILLHWLDPSLYTTDPFVRAFDSFNPHRGWLALNWALSVVMGLPAGLMVLFVATFVATCRGIDRLARAAWPESTKLVGSIAILLVLAAKAGNIGTNHLFEAMVLDRLTALALGWNAMAELVASPSRSKVRVPVLLGLAALIHPSLGLQLALIVAGTWFILAVWQTRTEVSTGVAVWGMTCALTAVIPGVLLNLQSGRSLLEGLSVQDFWTLAVELQSPQHMLPHLWRLPQWLAWGCYLILAGLSLTGRTDRPPARTRLVVMLATVLLWLAGGWIAIEVLRHARITVFQPFRMATVARGIALVLIAGRLGCLWNRGSWLDRTRVILVAVGLTGDWMMVVATVVEVTTTIAELIRDRSSRISNTFPVLVFLGSLIWGLWFLGSHDTESGHRTILLVLAGWLAIEVVRRRARLSWVARARRWSDGRPRIATAWIALAWTVPSLALVAGLLPEGSALARTPVVHGLVARCRFLPVPVDDIERLALWCRDHTPTSARFVGPPGPKTFRLWSRRSLVFNRAGSPYHAAGLADWFVRFQDHVASKDPPEGFVRRYQMGRHTIESAYDQLGQAELAALARRQGADHVVAASPGHESLETELNSPGLGPLRLLHSEGQIAVYRVDPP